MYKVGIDIKGLKLRDKYEISIEDLKELDKLLVKYKPVRKEKPKSTFGVVNDLFTKDISNIILGYYKRCEIKKECDIKQNLKLILNWIVYSKINKELNVRVMNHWGNYNTINEIYYTGTVDSFSDPNSFEKKSVFQRNKLDLMLEIDVRAKKENKTTQQLIQEDNDSHYLKIILNMRDQWEMKNELDNYIEYQKERDSKTIITDKLLENSDLYVEKELKDTMCINCALNNNPYHPRWNQECIDAGKHILLMKRYIEGWVYCA